MRAKRFREAKFNVALLLSSDNLRANGMGFIDFLYGTSVLNLGLVVTAIMVGGTFVALLLVNRFWNRELRRDHNDIAGFLIAVVGVVFAILVSSLAIIVLERKDHAEALVVQEAQALQSIQRETDLLAPEIRKVMRSHVLDYLGAILDGDWPEMREAKWPTASRTSADALWNDIVALPVTNFSEMLTAQNLRKQLEKLAEIRLDRSTIATSGVDPVVWSVVLLGSVATSPFRSHFRGQEFCHARHDDGSAIVHDRNGADHACGNRLALLRGRQRWARAPHRSASGSSGRLSKMSIGRNAAQKV